jgi:hypothetical protein
VPPEIEPEPLKTVLFLAFNVPVTIRVPFTANCTLLSLSIKSPLIITVIPAGIVIVGLEPLEFMVRFPLSVMITSIVRLPPLPIVPTVRLSLYVPGVVGALPPPPQVQLRALQFTAPPGYALLHDWPLLLKKENIKMAHTINL